MSSDATLYGVIWQGDADAFATEIATAMDLRSVASALKSIPAEAWPQVQAILAARLFVPAPGEPEHAELRQGVPLTERFRSPAALLRRQVRLQKLRLLAEETDRRAFDER